MSRDIVLPDLGDRRSAAKERREAVLRYCRGRRLTWLETCCAVLAAEGVGDKAAAAALGISDLSARRGFTRAMDKLGIEPPTHAVLAAEAGLLAAYRIVGGAGPPGFVVVPAADLDAITMELRRMACELQSMAVRLAALLGGKVGSE